MTEFFLDFPPKTAEYEIVETKLRQMGVGPHEFEHQKGVLSGKYADEIGDFLKIVDNLRNNRDLTEHPSVRDTIDFVNALRVGCSFKDAFQRAIGNMYVGYQVDSDLYKDAMKEALQSVDRL